MTAFEELAAEVRRQGEPYDGITLRYTAKVPSVACRACGELTAPGLMGWASDWLTLCQEARRHALDKGHEVAVACWNGAVYGPLRDQEETREGGENERDQGPEGEEAPQEAPGRF